MARVKRGVTSRAKHKKVLKAVKGQWGRRKNTIRVAKQAMEKAMQYAYRAEIAYDSPEAFKTIVQKAQSALN
jgi:large subunit ribosomal protein L20